MKHILRGPMAIFAIGLLIGIGLLLLVSRFVNIAATLHMVQQNLATPRGIVLALLSGVAFLLAFSIRGIRWKLFLSSISTISTGKAIRLFLVSIFLNFLLPISGGDIAKTLMLKRIAAIPISRSLPAVAMDRSLDLLPAFAIMAIVPLLGLQMDVRLWLVLCAVGGLLIVLACFIGLTVWKRTAAISILHRITDILPRAIGSKMEAFATDFVDSLLAGARRPHIFLPAVALTCLAVTCDSLFAMFAFWTIGLGLLHLPADKVAAMFIFSHAWAALLMTTAGLICLKTLGLTIPTTMKMRPEESKKESEVVFSSEEQTLSTRV